MVYFSPLRKIALFCALFIYQLVSCHATDYCPPFDGMTVRVLFVNNACTGSTEMGTFENPYTDLSSALFQSAPCDVIYVAPGNAPYNVTSGSYFLLQDNQRLLGTSTEAFEFCSNCPKPRLTNTLNTIFSPIVTMANNNEIAGFILDMTAGNNLIGITLGSLSEGSLINNNDFIASNPSGQAIFFTIGIGDVSGPFIISNCTFTGEATYYIRSIVNGSYNLIIENNRFSGAAQYGINIRVNGTTSISILSNLIENTSDLPIAGIYVENGFLNSPSLQLNITNNVVYINPRVSTASLLAGIYLLNGLGSICLSLNENSVRTPTTFPGYNLTNRVSDGAFRINENANLGTIETNSGEVTYFPITFTETCP